MRRPVFEWNPGERLLLGLLVAVWAVVAVLGIILT